MNSREGGIFSAAENERRGKKHGDRRAGNRGARQKEGKDTEMWEGGYIECKQKF